MISSNAKESSAVIELFARLLNTVLSEFSGSFPIATGRNLKSKCQNRVLTYSSSVNLLSSLLILFIYHVNVFGSHVTTRNRTRKC